MRWSRSAPVPPVGCLAHTGAGRPDAVESAGSPSPASAVPPRPQTHSTTNTPTNSLYNQHAPKLTLQPTPPKLTLQPTHPQTHSTTNTSPNSLYNQHTHKLTLQPTHLQTHSTTNTPPNSLYNQHTHKLTL